MQYPKLGRKFNRITQRFKLLTVKWVIQHFKNILTNKGATIFWPTQEYKYFWPINEHKYIDQQKSIFWPTKDKICIWFNKRAKIFWPTKVKLYDQFMVNYKAPINGNNYFPNFNGKWYPTSLGNKKPIPKAVGTFPNVGLKCWSFVTHFLKFNMYIVQKLTTSLFWWNKILFPCPSLLFHYPHLNIPSTGLFFH